MGGKLQRGGERFVLDKHKRIEGWYKPKTRKKHPNQSQQVRTAARDVGRFFFFQSKRRHTNFDCDWSSDVCSSDLERNFFVRLVGDDDMIGEAAAQLLQPYQRAINHRSTASAESCRVHFRGQVMMVVDETFAEQFVKQRNEYEGVGRIVGVDRIKAFAKESHDRKREGGSHRVGVFPKV